MTLRPGQQTASGRTGFCSHDCNHCQLQQPRLPPAGAQLANWGSREATVGSEPASEYMQGSAATHPVQELVLCHAPLLLQPDLDYLIMAHRERQHHGSSNTAELCKAEYACCKQGDVSIAARLLVLTHDLTLA